MQSSVTEFSVEGILATLRAEGMRITTSRRGIVRALFKAERPLALTEIQERATRESGVSPDYATVFRMMALLERLRIVHKVNLKRPCSYYELTDPSKHYDHLVCTGCGKVVLLSIPCPVGETERMIENDLGFSGLSHSLEFFGRCPECTRKVTGAAIEEPALP